MLGRSEECEAVLRRYGLEKSSMAVIGADRLLEDPDWLVMITGDGRNTSMWSRPASWRPTSDLDARGKFTLSW